MTDLLIAMLCSCDRNEGRVLQLGEFPICESKHLSYLGMLTTDRSGLDGSED